MQIEPVLVLGAAAVVFALAFLIIALAYARAQHRRPDVAKMLAPLLPHLLKLAGVSGAPPTPPIQDRFTHTAGLSPEQLRQIERMMEVEERQDPVLATIGPESEPSQRPAA